MLGSSEGEEGVCFPQYYLHSSTSYPTHHSYVPLSHLHSLQLQDRGKYFRPRAENCRSDGKKKEVIVALSPSILYQQPVTDIAMKRHCTVLILICHIVLEAESQHLVSVSF